MIELPKSVIDDFGSRFCTVLTSGNLAEGAVRRSLESKIANYKSVNAGHVILTSSCGTGLLTLLSIMKEYWGKNICYIQSNTMYGVPGVARMLGYEVRSISSKNFVMDDSELLNKLINDNQRDRCVVIYSHIGGSTGSNIQEITNICHEYCVPLIEDSAHNLKAEPRVYGSACVYSMYATKAAPAGEGGIIVIRNDHEVLAQFVRRFVMYDRVNMIMNFGCNVRVSEIQALLMLSVIDNVDEIIDDRLRQCIAYQNICDELGIKYHPVPFVKGSHNGYKFIITDPRVVKYARDIIPPLDREGRTPEYLSLIHI